MRFRKVVPEIRLVVSTTHHVAQIASGAKPQRVTPGNKGRTFPDGHRPTPHIGVKQRHLFIVHVQTESGGWIGHPPFQKEEGGMSKMPFFLVLQWRRWRIEIRLIRR
ncbi:hypothetical protein [Azospirillum palustre]